MAEIINLHVSSISALSNALVAQDRAETKNEESEGKYFFRNKKLNLTTFYAELAPGTSFSQINGKLENTTIFSAGLIFNKKFFLGFFSESSPALNKIGVPQPGTQKYQNWLDGGVDLSRIDSGTDSIFVTYRQSGLHLGYLHNTSNIIFWRAGLRLGIKGGVRLSESKTFLGIFDNPLYETKVFTITPEIGIGVNLLPWWRVHLDLGYRVLAANKINEKVVSGEKYNSLTTRLGFSFGAFK